MGKVNFTVEKMRISDAQEVAVLGKSTNELQVEDGINQYYGRDSLVNAVKDLDNICLVARVREKLAGFAMGNYHPYFKEAYLSDLVVKNEFRGLGIGKALFDKLRTEFQKKGANWSWGLVRVENKRMQKIMESLGYRKGNKFYFYYKNGI